LHNADLEQKKAPLVPTVSNIEGCVTKVFFFGLVNGGLGGCCHRKENFSGSRELRPRPRRRRRRHYLIFYPLPLLTLQKNFFSSLSIVHHSTSIVNELT
jgi:hypothetical protein